MERRKSAGASTTRKNDAATQSGDSVAAVSNMFNRKERSGSEMNSDLEELGNLFENSCIINGGPAKSKRSKERGIKIFEKMLENDTLGNVDEFSTAEMKPCCKSYFKSLTATNAEKLWSDTCQGSEAWKQAREFRITGSRIYGIYTYTKNKSPDWEKKSKEYFWPKTFTNEYVRHGIEHEKIARETYENETKKKVYQCGFIVHPDHPWVGYSPDGLIVHGKPRKLIEIKCVYAGKDKTITDCLSSCGYLDENKELKKKHTYYGQIQLGMLLCNVKSCDFIVFASFDKSIHVVSVPFDEEFTIKMFTAVRKAYFENMLHHVCLGQDGEE